MTLPTLASVFAMGQSNVVSQVLGRAKPGPWPVAIENEHQAIITYRNGVVSKADADRPCDYHDDAIGQLCARFCRRILDATGAGRVWCLNRGKGGSSIVDSLPGGELYEELIADIATLQLQPEDMLWSQGEADHSMPTQVWYNHFVTLYDALLAALPSLKRIFMFRTAIDACGQNTDKPRAAQDDCGANLALVNLIDTDAIDLDWNAHGTCHYNYYGYGPLADLAFDLR